MAIGLLMVAVSADSPAAFALGQAGTATAKAALHKMAQDKLSKVASRYVLWME